MLEADENSNFLIRFLGWVRRRWPVSGLEAFYALCDHHWHDHRPADRERYPCGVEKPVKDYWVYKARQCCVCKKYEETVRIRAGMNADEPGAILKEGAA